MASENETVADIVKEKRDTADEAELKGKNIFAFDLAKMLREEANRIEAAHQREVAELLECLNEAIREKCPFTRMSCKHGEPCDYECGTYKWRKALEGAKDETNLRHRLKVAEEAATQPVTNCNHLGDAARMREALRGLLEIVCVDCKSPYEINGKCVKCPRVVAAEAALAKASGEREVADER